MRREKLRLWLRGGACCLFVLCLALARCQALWLDRLGLEGLRVLRLSRPLSGAQGERMEEDERQEEHPVSFALWGQRSGVMVKNPQLERYAVCEAVSLCGNSQLVFPSAVSLAGGQADSCLIDRATAVKLFGSPRPLGAAVEIGGTKYALCGVFESVQPVVLIPARPQEQELNHVTLRTPQGDPPKQAADSFARRHGLAGELSDPGFLAMLARGLSLLPAAAILLGVVVRGARAALCGNWLRLCLGLALAGGFWFLTLWLCGFRFWIPEEMIPNKWSDFDFWGRLFEEKQAQLLDSFTRGQTVFELAVILPLLRAGFWGILGAALTPLLPQPKTGAQAWIWCVAGALLAFMAAVYLGDGLSGDMVLWAALPAGLLGRFSTFLLRDGPGAPGSCS